ncbi:hypothetical protein FXB39_06245 [Nocardioides sp. BGMRC 2183]|nr:hypothetical protein FXB39_06245 [Nocardioides sp. BGMRC 2183]
MSDQPVPVRPDSARSVSGPRSTATVVLAVIALIVAIPQAVCGVLMWVATENETTEDPLVGVGYLVALFLGIPGLIGVLLAVPALLLSRRQTGVVLAVLALVAVAMPVIAVVAAMLPGPTW